MREKFWWEKEGYSYHESYLCRHCGEMMGIHNQQWEHIGRDHWEGETCEGGRTKAEPIPLWCLHTWNEHELHMSRL